jgi:hypothetical protein
LFRICEALGSIFTTAKKQEKNPQKGWRCNSVLEHLPHRLKALDYIPNIRKKIKIKLPPLVTIFIS